MTDPRIEEVARALYEKNYRGIDIWEWDSVFESTRHAWMQNAGCALAAADAVDPARQALAEVHRLLRPYLTDLPTLVAQAVEFQLARITEVA